MPRPEGTEYAEYYHRYVALVPDGDVLETLDAQGQETRALLASTPPELETYRYAPRKWSVRDVVGHLIDTERMFVGRALWVARTPSTPLPSMEQDEWAQVNPAGGRPLAALLDEWGKLRASTTAFFHGLDEEALMRVGVAAGVHFTVRSFAWIIAGHELHHRRLLREAYHLGSGAAADAGEDLGS